MADIASGNVTYTLLVKRKREDGRVQNKVRLAFGDGALTVPANGIPLLKASMGCPNTIESLSVVDKGLSGYVFNYVGSSEKLAVFYGDNNNASDGPLIEASTVAIAAQTVEVEIIGW